MCANRPLLFFPLEGGGGTGEGERQNAQEFNHCSSPTGQEINFLGYTIKSLPLLFISVSRFFTQKNKAKKQLPDDRYSRCEPPKG